MEEHRLSKIMASYLLDQSGTVGSWQKLLVLMKKHGKYLCCAFVRGWVGCVAQRKHSCFPPSSPGFKSRLCRDFSLYCLVSVQYWDWTHLVLCKGFHRCSQRWRPELSTTKNVLPLSEWFNRLRWKRVILWRPGFDSALFVKHMFKSHHFKASVRAFNHHLATYFKFHSNGPLLLY